MQRGNSLEKTLKLGKIEGKSRSGWQSMRWVDSITDSIDMNLSKLWEIVEDRGTCCAVVHVLAKSETQQQLKNNRPKTQHNFVIVQFSSGQLLSHVWLFATPWTTGCQASLSITNSRSPPKPMSIELVMPSNHLVLCHPLLFLPSIFPSIRVFANELALCIRWPKFWSLSFNIRPSDEYSGLISFRMDWLDLLAVQGTLKSLLQHHSSKAPILQHSAFFIVQLSHPYMTTGKTIALTRRTLFPLWGINSSVLSFLYSPTLTSIHDHWKNHSLD